MASTDEKLAKVEELVKKYWKGRAQISLNPDRRHYSVRSRQRDKQALQNMIFKDISMALGIDWEPIPTKVPE